MRRSPISTLLMLATLTALLTSCSRNPMSPELTAAAAGGAQMMGGAQSDDTPAGFEGGGLPGSATTSLEVGAEARLTVGRFTLDLHKNSLKKAATISMHVASEDAMEVEIVITPADANNLKVAADLSANMSDRPGTDYDTVWMEFASNGDWARCIDVATHPNQKTVVAKLQQMSTFRVVDDQPNVAAAPEQAKKK